MPGSPGFKRCESCRDAMPASDGHSACIKCLGEAHQTQKCQHCSKLTARARRDRANRLTTLLYEKSLRPSSDDSPQQAKGMEKDQPPTHSSSATPKSALPPASAMSSGSPVSTVDMPGTSGTPRSKTQAPHKRAHSEPNQKATAPAASAPKPSSAPTAPSMERSVPKQHLTAPGPAPKKARTESLSTKTSVQRGTSAPTSPPKPHRSAPSHSRSRYRSPVRSHTSSAPPSPTSSIHSTRSHHSSASGIGTEPRSRFSSQHSSPSQRLPSWQMPAVQYAYPPPPHQWYPHQYPYPPPPYATQWQPWSPHPKRSHHRPSSTVSRPPPASPPATTSATEPNSPAPSDGHDSLSDGETRSPMHNSSSSPDEAVTTDAPPSGDDTKKFQELFKRVALAQEKDLQEVQVKQYRLLRSLQPPTATRIAIPMDEAIMDPANNIWQTPASITPTNKRVDRKYFIAPKDMDFLFTHPPPNSLVVDSVRHKGKQPNLRSTPQDRDHKKVDIMGRKVYSSSTLLLRAANYTAMLADYDNANYAKLQDLLQHLPEHKRPTLRSIMQEGLAISRTALQSAMDVADTAARITASAIVLRRMSWLQPSGVPRDLQQKVEDLPFDRTNLFASKTDEVLHSMKDSRTTLRTLGMYTPPFRRNRYQPYQRPREPFRQQPKYDFRKQRPLRRRPQRQQQHATPHPPAGKQQV
ncbi:uncharacterized protein LOC142830175 [Pelodiscus sinensis]|uniref:uncharacterized protein LOC142830175 n=1 Tax=Pelodiscus sinensis TaxID=13735 RepID=UPI003F6B4EA0